MSFDDIPEDREQSYPCICGGNIKVREDGHWECDTCDWVSVLTCPTTTGTEPDADIENTKQRLETIDTARPVKLEDL